MKNLFSFMILAIAISVAGFFLRIVGKESRSVVAWSDIFSIPVASADVPSAGGESAGGSGCEGGSCG
jgi:hypothetical protein